MKYQDGINVSKVDWKIINYLIYFNNGIYSFDNMNYIVFVIDYGFVFNIWICNNKVNFFNWVDNCFFR